MAYPFKIGDVVRLKGGGEKMTVTRVETDGAGDLTISCRWFVGTECKSFSFPADALMVAERPTGNRMATDVDFDINAF
jgi:uncharacterized protein YodC (DUF2158 family)